MRGCHECLVPTVLDAYLQPDWNTAGLNPNDHVPGFEDGYTSLAHP
jgi:hypothetical protein